MDKKYKSICMLLCVLMTAIAIMSGCSAKITADISSYSDTKIAIKGLKNKDFTVTPKELSDLKCVKETAEGKSAKAGKVTAIGPTLSTFLEQYDYKQEDFSKIILKASDGYTTVFDNAFLRSHETIVLAVSNDDEALKKDEQPMRVLIPEADSANWTKMVVEMQFEK